MASSAASSAGAVARVPSARTVTPKAGSAFTAPGTAAVGTVLLRT